MSGSLYIVSTPIGDSTDITLRAIEILRTCDIIVCEEFKPAKALLHKLSIDKPLMELNEHSKAADTDEIIEELRLEKNIALISDCGTPLIADPGSSLVKKCIEEEISVIPIPGVSSILAAIVVSGFSLSQFSFIGFLPREKTERKKAAALLRNRPETMILLEAPYRLQQVLDDLESGIGSNRNACVCLDLTLPKEQIVRGTLSEIKSHFQESPFKGEFVIIIEGYKGSLRSGGRQNMPNLRVRNR
jgi:16S rRNA (cytidine1402-2'-O)-methyltransferase